MLLIVEQFLNGLQFGLLLFLLAAGLTLVFGIMDFVNLAHGSLYMMGAYFAATFVEWTGSFILGIVLALGATLLLAWHVLTRLSEEEGWARRLFVPALFGIMVFYLWEVLVRGFHVPLILMPPPSLIASTFFNNMAMLGDDFVQTVLRSALRGYIIGCAAGFGLAIVCDRFPALGRGVLPYGNLISAVPMVGIADSPLAGLT